MILAEAEEKEEVVLSLEFGCEKKKKRKRFREVRRGSVFVAIQQN